MKSLKDLYAILPSSGRLQINSVNMMPYRDAVYRVVDSLLESKECSEMWNSYLKSLDIYEQQINSKVGSDISSRKDTEISKIRDQIANYILSGRKDYLQESSYDKVLENRNHRISEGDAGRLYRDTDIVRSRLNSRNSDMPIRKGIGRLLAQRQREIEQEIDQYLHEQSRSMEL